MTDKLVRFFALAGSDSPDAARYVERALAILGGIMVARGLVKAAQLGPKGLVGAATDLLLAAVPGAQGALDAEIDSEAAKAVADMFDNDALNACLGPQNKLPEVGMDRQAVLDAMRALSKLDCKAEDGRVFAYTYTTAEEGFSEFKHEATDIFSNENALNPMAFPALKRFEVEVVDMGISLMGGKLGQHVGSLTSGGTESIMMALKTYRDYARERRGIFNPEVIVPRTVHPAFFKGCHYFNIKPVVINERADLKVDVDAMRKAINKNTILLVGSAPQYPHGVVDPITEIGALGIEKHLPVHVDACIGGWVLPFLRKLGHEVPAFDFSVPGVTSISADMHKYGYAPKGSSVVLYSSDDYRKFQFFAYSTWPGGLFASPSMLGTRGGGAIAGAWATLLSLGESGFLDCTRKIMETKKYMVDAIESDQLNQDLYMYGKSESTLICFAAKPHLNILAIADVMEDDFGWHIERQQLPSCLHLSLMPQHLAIKEQFIADLVKSVEKVKAHPELASKGSAAMYGMVASIPTGSVVENFMTAFLAKVYTTTSKQ